MQSYKTISKLICSVLAVAIASCSYVGHQGPAGVKIKPKERDSKSYVIIDINESNIAHYNSKNGSNYSSAPHSKRSARYSDLISYRDKLALALMDNREAGFIKGVVDFGPVEVGPNGYVSFPYAGRMRVVGRNLSSVEGEIKDKLKNLSDSVQVSLTRVGRQLKRANVVGLVGKPGQHLIDRSGMTITDLVALSGGTTKSPELCQYTLFRNGREYVLSNRQISSGRVLVQDGDQIMVSTNDRYYINILGAVGRQARVPFQNKHSKLADFLATIGGLRLNANARGVFIFRSYPNRKTHVYKFNLYKPEGLILASQFRVRSGDTIYVSEAPLSKWNRTIKNILSLSSISEISNASRIPKNFE